MRVEKTTPAITLKTDANGNLAVATNVGGYLTASNPSTAKSITTTAWTKLFSTNNSARIGWRCTVPYNGGTNIYFLVVTSGTSVGADLLTFTLAQATFQAIPPGITLDDGANSGMDIYACADVQAVTLNPVEIL